MTSEDKPVAKVIVKPEAFCAMSTHAANYPNDEIHGVLLGKFEDKTSTVYESVPVAHGPPTRPLAELALGLIPSLTEYDIIGWYTAPMLLEDTKPSPVALRVASSLKSGSIEPTLILLKNEAIATCLKGGSASESLQALGKDFADQYLDEIETTIEKSETLSKAAQSCKEISVIDFSEHLDKPTHAEWFPNKELKRIIGSL